MQKGFNSVCIDANILIHATFQDFDEAKHLKSLKTLDSFADSGVIIYVTPQILREFFAISTNSTIFKKPLSNKQAVKKIKEFLNYFRLASENDATIQSLLHLLEKYGTLRQKIHDMNIVATMLDNDIRHLLTFNGKDFKDIKEITLIDV